MLIRHAGSEPQVDPTAWVAPNAVLSGDVSVGPHARVLFGAVLTAEGGAALRVGARTVVMEQAVLRAAGRFPLIVGHHVLIGPHAYLSGCEVGDHCFIATGAMVFNGASLGDACVVALDGKVHIQSHLPPGSRVPIGFIAIGRPAQIYPPDQAPAVHEELARLDFMGYVFGVGSRERSRAEVMEAALNRYVRGLSSHQDDTAL